MCHVSAFDCWLQVSTNSQLSSRAFFGHTHWLGTKLILGQQICDTYTLPWSTAAIPKWYVHWSSQQRQNSGGQRWQASNFSRSINVVHHFLSHQDSRVPGEAPPPAGMPPVMHANRGHRWLSTTWLPLSSASRCWWRIQRTQQHDRHAGDEVRFSVSFLRYI